MKKILASYFHHSYKGNYREVKSGKAQIIQSYKLASRFSMFLDH